MDYAPPKEEKGVGGLGRRGGRGMSVTQLLPHLVAVLYNGVTEKVLRAVLEFAEKNVPFGGHHIAGLAPGTCLTTTVLPTPLITLGITLLWSH